MKDKELTIPKALLSLLAVLIGVFIILALISGCIYAQVWETGTTYWQVFMLTLGMVVVVILLIGTIKFIAWGLDNILGD